MSILQQIGILEIHELRVFTSREYQVDIERTVDDTARI